ncbi:hypothetical protein EV421DRAFT_1511087 [Armillaria borealis]|uniref:Uncharacterized protein n=1 Tax=Armillaria borealis TaxID=47425 RepID=A0AA39MFU7_9AGAR|nr:hypothetical protein EV421DRAFT_1511087 [Armillaria borealis]
MTNIHNLFIQRPPCRSFLFFDPRKLPLFILTNHGLFSRKTTALFSWPTNGLEESGCSGCPSRQWAGGAIGWRQSQIKTHSDPVPPSAARGGGSRCGESWWKNLYKSRKDIPKITLRIIDRIPLEGTCPDPACNKKCVGLDVMSGVPMIPTFGLVPCILKSTSTGARSSRMQGREVFLRQMLQPASEDAVTSVVFVGVPKPL